ncbi:MAG: septal ring lytic transglycosylase RlpA family protein [Burkholderiales bacterium]|nr:septal ring lytic transglycosylase RlpA family protein [Burkholderiales bacterium]
MKAAACAALALVLSGCGALVKREEPAHVPKPASQAPAPERRPGAYYLDDGPGEKPPADLASIPDAVPRAEPLHRFANRPYQAFGREYVPLADAAGFRQRGLASWYGRRYHGQKTASGEVYDMYAMTAAHPVLPIPSYARVTNPANGRSVVVRINDRGPFHGERVIDLSYTAAWKLGFVEQGTALVEIEAIAPGGAPLAAAAPAAAPAGASEGGDAKGVFLQLGAFSARESAEAFRARLALELGWLTEAARIFASGGLYRLKLGPYGSREQARPIAERIESELKLRPLFVAR